MAQWARKGKRGHIGHTWADDLCALQVEDGAIVAGRYMVGCPVAVTAEAAVKALADGATINVLNDKALVEGIREQWAARFEEPALAPDLAADLDEVINNVDRALLEEMNVAADALAAELATWAASKKPCPKCNGTGWTEWAHGVNGNCTECLGFGVALVEEPDQAQIDRINHDFETAARLDREARQGQGDYEFLAWAD